MRQRELRQRQARQIGTAQLEEARTEAKEATFDSDVAEIDEGEQEAPRGTPRKSGRAGDLAERQRAVRLVEGLNHRQPALQRLDEVGLPVGETGLRCRGRFVTSCRPSSARDSAGW